MSRCAGLRGLSLAGTVLTAVALAAGGGCQSDPEEAVPSIAAYRDRMLAEHQEQAGARESGGGRKGAVATPVAAQAHLPERAALMVQPAVTAQPAPAEVLAELPDPLDLPEVLAQRLRQLQDAARPDERLIENYQKVVNHTLEQLEEVAKPQQVRLSLAECIQRALQHSYAIRLEAYNPAISQTQLVEAQAAFDAEFFLDSSWFKQDQATASTFMPSTGDDRSYQAGFRKFLPTGMQVSTSLGQRRQKNDLPEQFQTMNPVYYTSFVVQFTQPLLRGFGLDVNRATINIRRAERDIAQEQFIQAVRDRLLDVETWYWRLVQARRSAAIIAETVAQNYVTYKNVEQRLDHDATEVEVAQARSRWLSRRVEFQETVKNIEDVEDQLKNLINDPELLLSHDVEIIPTQTPFAAALTLDQLAAVRTALDSRSEIRQARRAIDQARISTAAAKNQTLPQLDLSFQYEVQGIGVSADSSFDNLTTNRFISYTVSAQFSVPIGNRGRQAAHRRARLQESQAIVGLHQATDTIVQEVNAAVRTLTVRYAQVPPQLEAVRSQELFLRSFQARAQQITPSYLDSELGAAVGLATTRNTLLQVIVDYNIAIAALERAKGTLLQYNNVVVTDGQPER